MASSPSIRFRLCLLLAAGGAACVGPSKAEQREARVVTERLMEAAAVYLPPDERASCVGRTVRLTEPGPAAAEERAALASRLSDEEVSARLDAAGWTDCRRGFTSSRASEGYLPEPVVLSLGYGVDPEGRVCAVVEQARPDLVDPRSIPLVDEAARCAKDALFRARFPTGLVEGSDRVVKTVELHLGGIEDEGAP